MNHLKKARNACLLCFHPDKARTDLQREVFHKITKRIHLYYEAEDLVSLLYLFKYRNQIINLLVGEC